MRFTSYLIYRSITENFPIKILLKTIDSSVKNLGEIEYDKQNYLRQWQIGTQPQNSQCTCVTVTVYGNPSATKKFPIKILLEMIVSSRKHLGEVEYDKQIYPQCDIPQVGELFQKPYFLEFQKN